jgi:hypothetical protein
LGELGAQVFVRDFVPRALAFLMNCEPDERREVARKGGRRDGGRRRAVLVISHEKTVPDAKEIIKYGMSPFF